MARNAVLGLTASKGRYTRRVTARRLLSVAGGAAALAALVFTATSASAQKKPKAPTTADAAAAASQAAKAVADAADQAGDQNIDPPKDDSAPATPLDRARDGVVVLERAGKVIGVGSVLSGDGRILTALSSLGHGNNVDARFADGSVSNVKVGHTDRAWDLALLLPQNGRWKKGLKASRKDATSAGSKLSAFSLIGTKDLAPARTIIKGERTLVGGDNELLHDALEVASRFKSSDIGSPVVDDKGDVVAVVARACAPVENGPCSQVPYGVPVSAVKAFLRSAPASAVPPAPWLGIQGVTDDAGPAKGVRVLSVHPRSPAAAAGLKAGSDAKNADMVLAVDQAPVTTPEALAEAINGRAIGDSIDLLLYGAGKYRHVTLTLRAAPDIGKAKSKTKAVRSTPAQKPKPPLR
jgi:serine protease Do